MKRVGGLFDAIGDASTLTRAAWRAARGKRGRPEVRRFLGRLDAEVAGLSRQLRAGRFEFGAYRNFAIRDPKTRTIHAPPFRDRVVHHAIVEVAGPVLERGAIAHTYACRTGRGQHAALRQARGWMRHDDWFLKMDVAKYYDSIAHATLRAALARRLRERRLLALFDRLLESHVHTTGRGLPIGALTSQYLGNFYLDGFDHWMLETARQPRYLRYMDDMIALGPHAALRELRDRSAARLAALGLRLKDDGVLNRCTLGVPLLGFVLYPDRTRLNRVGRRRLRRRTKELERAWERGTIAEPELQARGEALFAHARGGDDVTWRRTVTGFSRLGEAPEPATGDPRRLVEQRRQELPLGLSQQERAR
jgi:RNA-directed DNA polymerase